MTFFLLLSLVFLIMALIIFFILFFTRKKNQCEWETDIKKNPKFAILIPARDESKVIEGLIQSIINQTRKVSLEDVFVIVEDKEDETVKICKKHGVSVIVRQQIELKSKGYALQEAIEFLVAKNIYYDAYFIFDADNVLDKHFIKEMEKDYNKGYGISTGYRNLNNGNAVLPIAAGLTYTFINEWINKNNLKYQKSLMLSGTGFFIQGKYIRKWKTYPFHSLTEDVELSHYATLQGIKMNYNDKAIFYDEQPVLFSQSVLQRKRWIRGYFQNYFLAFPKYRKAISTNPKNIGSMYSMILGIQLVICLVCSFFSFLLFFLCQFLFQKNILALLFFFLLLCLLYGVFAFGTMILLLKEGKKLKFDEALFGRVVWYHPLFLFSYVYVFILTIFQKNVSWDKIEHHSK
jgi:cellulose synthase/poly-beta-1,6-N-acetylglucosamine synthase-like glycosyltransferase